MTTNIAFRPGTDDEDAYNDVRRNWKWLGVRPGDVVLDLGAHVGYSVEYFNGQGADRIIAVEPDPTSFAQLVANTKAMPVVLINAAVADVAGPSTLWLNPGKGKMWHSLDRRRGREPVPITTITLGPLLESYQPTILKCDIEGGEYRLDFSNLPAYVRAVGLEVHFDREDLRARKLAATLDTQFTAVRPVVWPKLLAFGRVGVWAR